MGDGAQGAFCVNCGANLLHVLTWSSHRPCFTDTVISTLFSQKPHVRVTQMVPCLGSYTMVNILSNISEMWVICVEN